MSSMFAANHLKGVTTLITMTKSGYTALMMSRISSSLPIFARSRYEHKLNLAAPYRSVTPVYFDSRYGYLITATDAVNQLRDKGFLVSGDLRVE